MYGTKPKIWCRWRWAATSMHSRGCVTNGRGLCGKQDSVFANYKSVFSRQFAVSLAVEFLGVMFFQIIGGTSAPNFAPFVTGPPVTPDSDLDSWDP